MEFALIVLIAFGLTPTVRLKWNDTALIPTVIFKPLQWTIMQKIRQSCLRMARDLGSILPMFACLCQSNNRI